MYQNCNPNRTNEDPLCGIHCDVTNCSYNQHTACVANEICVGPQYASTSADTACATFKPKD